MFRFAKNMACTRAQDAGKLVIRHYETRHYENRNNCNVPEDTEHYFLQCPRYEPQRRTMFLEIESTLNDKNLSRKILGKNLQFLSENKNLSKSTREQILCSIEIFLRETKRLL